MSLYRPTYADGGKSPVYSYDFTCNGKRYKGSTGETSKPLAREVETEKRKEARSGTGRKKISPITFDVLADKYIELHIETNLKRQASYRMEVRRLRKKLGKRMVPSITPLDCAAVMAERWRQTDKEATYNNTLNVLKHMFKKAEAWGFLTKGTNPADGVGLKKVNNQKETAPNMEDVEAIMAECPDWLAPVVMFSFLTGARSGECRSLTWEYVNFERGHLTFMNTKNDTNRQYQIGDKLLAFLESLKGDHPFGGGVRVFLWNGEAISDGMLQRYFKIATAKAGLPWTFHDLRAGWATAMGDAGVPLRTLMTLAGWSRPETAMRYLRNSKHSRQLAVEAQGRAFGNDPHQIHTVETVNPAFSTTDV